MSLSRKILSPTLPLLNIFATEALRVFPSPLSILTLNSLSSSTNAPLYLLNGRSYLYLVVVSTRSTKLRSCVWNFILTRGTSTNLYCHLQLLYRILAQFDYTMHWICPKKLSPKKCSPENSTALSMYSNPFGMTY